MQMVWKKFAERYKEEVHLYNTLLLKPLLVDQHTIELHVANSVQQEQIKKIKSEIYGHLSRTLQNTMIEINIIISEVKTTSTYKTDEQRFKDMAEQNEALKELKMLFNLDYGN